MKSEPEDKQLRNLFAQIRAEDVQSSPPFIETWSAATAADDATARRTMAWTRWLRPVPLGFAAAAMMATLLLLRTGTDTVTSLDNLDGEPTITAWTAPSTSFLGFDGSEFLDLSEAALLADSLEAFDWDSPTDGLIETAIGELGEEREL